MRLKPFLVLGILFGVLYFFSTGCSPKSGPSSPNPAPTDTPAITATTTSTTTNSPTKTLAGTATNSPTATVSSTATVSPTSTASPTPTNSATSTATGTITNTPTATNTGTVSQTPTNTGTSTGTDTPTDSPTVTATETITDTPTVTATHTATLPFTSTPTGTVPPHVNGGVVSTLAGAGSFKNPEGVAADGLGNVYVADTLNYEIKVINGGSVSILAGSGTSNYVDGTGTGASFGFPIGLCLNPDGTILYVADAGADVIRQITLATGAVTTLAGSGGLGFSNGTGMSVSFYGADGVAADNSGNLFVADQDNNAIREINVATGFVGTLAFSPSNYICLGATGAPQVDRPVAVAVNSSGTVYEVGGCSLLLQVSSGGAVNYYSSSASFYNPQGVAVDSWGTVYVSDSWNNLIRVIPPGGAVVGILAGNTLGGGFSDGTGTHANFSDPTQIAVDPAGNVYVADSGNNAIREIQ